MNIGFYAGSFDPFTFGHLHVIKKSCAIFDKVIVGIGFNLNKKRRYDKERMKSAMEKLFENKGLKNIEVICYNNMTIDTARKYNANILIRGIRNGMDYAYEENIAQINEELAGIDTIYIRAGKYGIVSSSMVSELIQNNQDVTNFVPEEIMNEFSLKKETIVFASQNKHKIEEVKNILPMYNILSLKDINFEGNIVEDGETFEENALIKAKSIIDYLKTKGLSYKVLSDDTGLCINALNGNPGVKSARYSLDHNDKSNREKVFRELKDKEDRTANFTCVMVLMDQEKNYKVGIGQTFGYITQKEYGNTSFGYDCIFFSNDLKITFGEATEEQKNQVSHRARALKNLFNI